MLLSIIVPAYNEQSTIAETLDQIFESDYGLRYEVIVINDGSTDSTSDVLEKAAKRRKIRLLNNERNLGKGKSILRGVDAADGDVFIIQDSDLEYHPSQIRKLIKPIINGECEVVYGSRYMGRITNQSKTFYLGNRLINLLFNLIYSSKLTDIETCYKAMGVDLFKSLGISSNGFEIEGEITAKLLLKGVSIKEIPIEYKARHKHQKKITVFDGVNTILYVLKLRLLGAGR